MPAIEILGYYPKQMSDFIFFCINGVPDGHGGWSPDKFGRPRTGVFDWLWGREVPEAHFFTSGEADPVQAFAATVQRPESIAVPWTDNIPGIEDFLVSDGEVGAAQAFPPSGSPLATVVTRPDLDQKFVDGGTKIAEILNALRNDTSHSTSITADAFKSALRGEAGTHLAPMLAEINEVFHIKFP